MNENNPNTGNDPQQVIMTMINQFSNFVAETTDKEVQALLAANGVEIDLKDVNPNTLKEKGYVLTHEETEPGVHKLVLYKMISASNFTIKLNTEVTKE